MWDESMTKRNNRKKLNDPNYWQERLGNMKYPEYRADCISYLRYLLSQEPKYMD